MFVDQYHLCSQFVWSLMAVHIFTCIIHYYMYTSIHVYLYTQDYYAKGMVRTLYMLRLSNPEQIVGPTILLNNAVVLTVASSMSHHSQIL